MPAVVPAVPPAQSLAPYVPDALAVVGKILSGRLRASVAVRAQVALRVIEMSREDRGRGADDAPEGSVLAQLAQALALRRRTVEAETVEPLSRGEPVAP